MEEPKLAEVLPPALSADTPFAVSMPSMNSATVVLANTCVLCPMNRFSSTNRTWRNVLAVASIFSPSGMFSTFASHSRPRSLMALRPSSPGSFLNAVI